MSRILLAYLATWNPFDLDKLPAEKLTHLCYAFAKVVNHQVGLQFAFEDARDEVELARFEQYFVDLQALKLRNPDLKIMISIGGWTADGFSDAALSAASRAEFADSAVKFMLDRQLDGIDMDWEYPSNDMAGIKARPEDKHNFSLMLEALRDRLDAASDREGRVGKHRYQLSIAAGAGQYYLDGVEIGRVAAACDFINMMTYDFYNGWAKRAGHHSNLFNSAVDPDGDSADKGIQLFINNGVPREKLVIGCPFYGRSLKGVGAKGLGESGLAGSNGAYGFRTIDTELLPSGRYTRHWDAAAQAPWLQNGDEFVSYEDRESIALKGRYAVEQQLAGAMFWEYTDDHNNALLDALYLSLQD
ncbi:glycoside hydrolase family 18 protein [Chitinibacter bivalviorum]|uniref:chitinase n=1 Tax=Chitinibacter bivalviorum TaxID=2739434 RepID=A0A7H9BFA1_9NEIS|nr:glycoside hydrolase family 18 protein [Chitinibacter bivalviorum]QLG86868.1 glycoside hydrolase family 18 protein [Chitinibacter bivalviorum]